ncbi:hypothetical protein DUNSADRAFT_5988 [Dunaliella salina]|uniref:Uncharacterized protein n=1 Tax=Dunaliella salina TaxID=3046 RepID=A0ABQ7GP89_DUNSA|nr:hypothetical protein DUNSADRAFT_5988 [Dunaliella salina]|eukprot:KAF5836418.1 hypothetical protein DUNSADRAFT_5988 [Dunaliella salina]
MSSCYGATWPSLHATAAHEEHAGLVAVGDQPTVVCCPRASRNYHLVPPTELERPLHREAAVAEQLETFGSSYRDAHIPHDLLLPMLLDELGPGPATAARTVQGSCLAVSHAPGGAALVLSASGAIGERLTLTVVRPGESLDATAWQSACVAELDLHKAIHQVEAKLEVHGPRQMALVKLTQQQQQQQQQQHRHLGNVNQLDQDGQEKNSLATPGASGCCLWVAVRCNTRAHVLRAHQEDEEEWDSWCLEWLGSVLASATIMHVAWSPSLPELAMALEDGSLHVASTRKEG